MASCLHPNDVFIKSAGHSFLVPCGKCAACLQRKKMSWVHRIEQERYNGAFKNCYIITLSYNEKYLPYECFSKRKNGVPVNPISSGEAVLNYYDLRMFFQRFRTASGEKIRYFAVGELGAERNRPHYHILLFTNLNWNETLKYTRVAWSRLIPETSRERYKRYKLSKKLGYLVKRDATNPAFRESFGRDQVRSVTFRRICYVAKYVNKLFGLNCTVPPFFRASKGLGDGFLKSPEADICRSQNLHYSRFRNGLPVALSRFYSNKLFTIEQMDAFKLDMYKLDDCPPEVFEKGWKAINDWTKAMIPIWRSREVSFRTKVMLSFNQNRC